MPRPERDADALDFYLDDLSRLSRLSREEEQHLALEIERAHLELRRLVLTHPPSLRRLARRLLETEQSESRPSVNLTEPLGPGIDADATAALLVNAGRRLRSLLELTDAENGAARPDAEAEALTVAAELPLGRALLRELFDGAAREVLDDERPETASLRQEWVEVTRSLRAAEHIKCKLAEHSLRLVVVLARRYAGRGLPLSDLIQEGNLGLLRAIDGFDPHRGFRLGTYAAWWIRQAMQHALSEQTRTIRVPRHLSEAAAAVGRFSRNFHHETGRTPTTAEIADGLGVSLARVSAATEIGPDAISLETPLGSEESLELGDTIADREVPSPAEVLLHKDFAVQTREVLESLADDEREVLTLRFGIGSSGSHSIEEVAMLRRLGTERVRQIEARALRKLRHAKRTRHLRAFVRD